jgi:hypothetical protein
MIQSFKPQDKKRIRHNKIKKNKKKIKETHKTKKLSKKSMTAHDFFLKTFLNVFCLCEH